MIERDEPSSESRSKTPSDPSSETQSDTQSDTQSAHRHSAAIRVSMMPKDTNPQGTIFGGIILSYIDQAGAVEARRYVPGRLVTVAMREVEFHKPVFVGDLVSFYAETIRIGRTSITVKVVVEAERLSADCSQVTVTEAEVVYVQIDRSGDPVPIKRRPPREAPD